MITPQSPLHFYLTPRYSGRKSNHQTLLFPGPPMTPVSAAPKTPANTSANQQPPTLRALSPGENATFGAWQLAMAKKRSVVCKPRMHNFA